MLCYGIVLCARGGREGGSGTVKKAASVQYSRYSILSIIWRERSGKYREGVYFSCIA